MKFRKLKAEEIEVKIGNVSKKGYTLLLYKNARVDMAILDETVGCENWQNRFYEVVGNLYCSLGINVNYENGKEPLWIWKDDCGVESAYGDKEKGQASDARKRAGFAWGIGRELYTSPFIFIFAKTVYDSDKKCYKLDDEDKFRKFKVSEIDYSDNGEISKLKIEDTDGTVAFATNNYKEKTEEVVNFPTSTKCEDCETLIDERVKSYSLIKYGKALCRDCQRKQPLQKKEL